MTTRRNFLAGMAAIPAVAIAPQVALSVPQKESKWVSLLSRGVDWESLYHPNGVLNGNPLWLLVDLAGGSISITNLDRALAELSGNRSVELFPRQIWKGCYVLSTPHHLTAYLTMRYELTAREENAEMDRAHEGAVWSIDNRIPLDVVLLEAANGKLGLIRRAFNLRVR